MSSQSPERVSTTASRPTASGHPVRVSFTVPAGLAQHAQLIAEFTTWTPIAMDRRDDGTHEVSVWLEAGHVWRYQFLLDDRLIVNDPSAAEFLPCRDGGHMSVVRV